MRAIVALEANGSPRDVALTVLGVPPAQTVIPWEDATIGGFAATRVLDEPARRRLARTRRAALAARALRARRGGGEGDRGDRWAARAARISCFVAPDDSSGRRAHATAALPVRLGPAASSRSSCRR